MEQIKKGLEIKFQPFLPKQTIINITLIQIQFLLHHQNSFQQKL